MARAARHGDYVAAQMMKPQPLQQRLMNNALPIIKPTGASGASGRGSHQLACASECGVRWRFRYRDRVIPRFEPDFRLGGTLIHDSLAHRYAERMMAAGGTAPSWWDGRSIQDVLDESGAGHPELIRNALEAYEVYPRHWWEANGGLREDWIPIAVEEEFKARVGDLDPEGLDGIYDDEVVTCRSDLVVRSKRTGALIIVDHKTKSPDYKTGKLPTWNPNGEYRVSWQAALNLLIVRLTFPGDIVAGFVVNRVTRRAPWDFDRHLLRISPRMYARTPKVIRHQVAVERSYDALLAEGRSPEPAYWNCYTRFGPCDYIDICDAATDEDARAIIDQHFTSRDVPVTEPALLGQDD